MKRNHARKNLKTRVVSLFFTFSPQRQHSLRKNYCIFSVSSVKRFSSKKKERIKIERKKKMKEEKKKEKM